MRDTGSAAWWRPRSSGAEIIDLTLGEMLDRQAATFADRPAVLVHEDEGARTTEWTYIQLKAEVDEIARGLIGLGVAPRDHVAVMAKNCREWVALEYALAKIGAVLVTVNPALLKDELDYLLTQGQVRTLIFSPIFRKNYIAVSLAALMPDLETLVGGRRRDANALPKLRNLIAIGEEPPEFAMPFDALRDLAADVPSERLAARLAEVTSTDVAQIQYTSGTTGKPKGAMLTHRSTLNNARLMAARGGYTEADTLLSAMPLFHTAGCVCNVMAMLVCGGRLITMDSFDPQGMLDLWHRHRPTMLNAVPTMVTRMFEHPEREQRDIRTLRRMITGGTTIPPSLMRRIRDETGGDPLIVMGMTECSPIITQTDPDDDFELQISTAGTPLPHTEIRIENPETGETCAWGEAGELCIRGYLVMAGYFDMLDKTAETLDPDGWLHSGDLAELSESGHLRIVGRLKDMIIRGGENVYPVEVEDCLLEVPGVSEAQVVGVSDPDLGEEVCAFVVPVPGVTIDPAALQAHCRARMARHKMPKYILPINTMPLTANGKVQKFVLRQRAEAGIAAGEIAPVRR